MTRRPSAAHVLKVLPAVLLLLCARPLAAAAAAPAGPEDAPRTVPALNPSTAELSFASPPYTVWTTEELVRGTVNNRVQSFTVRHFLQKVGADEATLAYETRGTTWARPLAVLDDGTLLLYPAADGLGYAKPGQELRVEEPVIGGESARPLKGWPDGLLLQPYVLNTEQPVYFVPLKEGRPDYAARVRITGDEDESVSSPPEFRRHRDRLAWVATTRPDPDSPQYVYVLRLFDLKTQTRRDIRLTNTGLLYALDDRHATLGLGLVPC